jgi:DNA-binding NtrC family response regulator
MVVVADDDKVLTHLLTRLLEDDGYEVCVAYDGESAYEHLKNPKCKAMLLDIRMPHINGAELLMLMAAEGSKVPVVVMAGFPDFDEEEMQQFPNVKKLLHKPLDPADVISAVHEYALK